MKAHAWFACCASAAALALAQQNPKAAPAPQSAGEPSAGATAMTAGGGNAAAAPRTVDNRGVQISYRVYGQGEPLVLIHGWSCEGRHWDEFEYVSRLSGQFQLIVPDLRGHGGSSTPADGDFTDAAFASDVVAVMDDLGVNSAHIFGYSLGGWVAFELASNFPRRARSIAVLGAHPYAENLSFFRNLSPADLLGGWEAAGATLSEEAKRRISAFDNQALSAKLPDRDDKSERLISLSIPRLLICGTNDFRFEDMKRYAANNPGWMFATIEAADHLQGLFRGQQVVPLLQDFLRETENLNRSGTTEFVPTPAIESRFAPIAGGRLYYETAGTGDPLVLVHGNIGDSRHWDNQFAAFAKEFRVIRYDVRGFGRSSQPREGEPYSDYEDLAALLDHLEVKSAHVAGWSMGSGIVVDFAVAYPQRTKSLIPVGPWVNGQSSPATTHLIEQMLKVGDVFAREGHSAALDLFMTTVLGPTVRDPAAGKKFRQIAAEYTFCRQSANFPRLLTPSAARRLAEIRVPTLIMTAEHELPACLDAAAMLKESVRNSRQIVMPGTGHLLLLEKPAEFNAHVLGFLRDLAKPDRQSATPGPAPEFKHLDVYVGTWQFEWTVHHTFLSPGGKITGTERYAWLPGGQFLPALQNALCNLQRHRSG